MTRQTVTSTDSTEIRSDRNPATDSVSLDVLCRRAERLIDTVRMLGEQVDRMFARPDKAVAEANQAAHKLVDLRDRLGSHVDAARQAEQAITARLTEVEGRLPEIQASAEGLIERIRRARDLTEAFGNLMEASHDRIARLEASADESRKAREAIAAATSQLGGVQQVADNWAKSVRTLAGQYAGLISAGNTAAGRLRTLTDAGARLRESVRHDIVTLRELLRESRLERLAWERLLMTINDAPRPTAANPNTAKPAASPAGAADATSGNTAVGGSPAALAERLSRLGEVVKDAAGPTARPEPPVAKPNAGETVTSLV